MLGTLTDNLGRTLITCEEKKVLLNWWFFYNPQKRFSFMGSFFPSTNFFFFRFPRGHHLLRIDHTLTQRTFLNKFLQKLSPRTLNPHRWSLLSLQFRVLWFLFKNSTRSTTSIPLMTFPTIR